MAADQTSAAGTDFWAAIDVKAQEQVPGANAPGDVLVAGPAAGSTPPEGLEPPRPQAPEAPNPPRPQAPRQRGERALSQVRMEIPVQVPGPAVPEAAAAEEAEVPYAAEPGWLAAERIARSLGTQLSGIWLDVLTRHTDGDETMARRVYAVLNGSHLLGEIWRDERIDEVHVRGTEVTVCGRDGMRRVPGFTSLAAARRAIEVFKASQEKTGAVVSRLGGAVVVSRRTGAEPDATALVDDGVITADQLSQITVTLQHMRAVTVTGPAARTVVRALASLIPAGSRVFLGAYATLPRGCVTAAGPMEADYVVGVRPGVVAEEMAAEGQVGALIANPETRIRAELRFAVSGQSAVPGRLTQLP
ncbi:hypothetical protein [Actinomadura algeriensis]|uniref:Uncharacterized protein n=1 Tax=Actinomadura algeriensis TaxID=1679523 RepID=A0ABR9JQW1_9ACTN|nr:hypothetical protein [Actinomadura algeriensis]MBE1532873.1 hypothetical protein [Actinomadura algeriensis]